MCLSFDTAPTTQTQNKTRQNYYAIIPVYAGEA